LPAILGRVTVSLYRAGAGRIAARDTRIVPVHRHKGAKLRAFRKIVIAAGCAGMLAFGVGNEVTGEGTSSATCPSQLNSGEGFLEVDS
jgi:hypothetical protein